MRTKEINVIKDFSKAPYGRTSDEVLPGEDDTSGERFRTELLAPALHKYDKVIVDLTGYNRYGPSFIDEAFGGLISSGEFNSKEINQKLQYKHDDLPSIVQLIKDRIDEAASYEKDPQ